MDWVDMVLEIGVTTKNDDAEGRRGTFGTLEKADVIWAAWSEDGQTPVVRAIRGRALTGHGLRHGVPTYENEVCTLDAAESHGDENPLREDGKTLDLPEPAVPPHLIALIRSDPVLLYDGSEMDFTELHERLRA